MFPICFVEDKEMIIVLLHHYWFASAVSHYAFIEYHTLRLSLRRETTAYSQFDQLARLVTVHFKRLISAPFHLS